jgi:peptide/nickel transport system permease protein
MPDPTPSRRPGSAKLGPGSSEPPPEKPLVAEADAEIYADAVVAEPGGAATPADAAGMALPRPRKRRPLGMALALAWIAAVVLLAVFADLLPFVRDPNAFTGVPRQGPTASHWFGLDDIGRDIFARSVYGARVSLIVGVSVVALGFALGGTLGIVAGYFRGRVESVIVSVIDVLLAFPQLVLALALVAFLAEPGKVQIRTVITALAVLSIAPIARITRAATLTFAQREFVLAARTLGASHWRIITREILPNVVPPMASYALLVIAVVIVVEGALSFLGLSVAAPRATWGNMINEGRASLQLAAHISLIPCGVMFLTLLSFNYVGDNLQARFNVRESGL